MTFVPIGAFSFTKPSMFDAVITGGLLSTGLTVIINLAVADRFVSDTSTALRKKKMPNYYIFFQILEKSYMYNEEFCANFQMKLFFLNIKEPIVIERQLFIII